MLLNEAGKKLTCHGNKTHACVITIRSGILCLLEDTLSNYIINTHTHTHICVPKDVSKDKAGQLFIHEEIINQVYVLRSIHKARYVIVSTVLYSATQRTLQ